MCSLPNGAVCLGVDEDWTLNNVSQSENMKLRSFTEILLSFLPVWELLHRERENEHCSCFNKPPCPSYRLGRLWCCCMLCCMLTPSIIEEKLSLNITQCEADCLTKEGSSIMDAPESKRCSMVEREAIILCLNKEKMSTKLFH